MQIEPLDQGQRFSDRLPELLLLSGLVFSVLLSIMLAQARRLHRAKLSAEDAVTRLFQNGRELERLATVDSLTGAYNRRHFMARLSAEEQRSSRGKSRYAVMLMDLDHFKRINDEYGHHAGDAVLKAFVETVNGVLRPNDIIGRYGGEEFVALLPDADEAGAQIVAERIRSSVEQLRVAVDGREVRVTVSIGIALATPQAPTHLLKLADSRLYAAKAGGRNRVVATGHEPATG